MTPACPCATLATIEACDFQALALTVRQRFEGAAELAEPEPGAMRKPEFVIVDHELSPSQSRSVLREIGRM
jgi:hypothetical protein